MLTVERVVSLVLPGNRAVMGCVSRLRPTHIVVRVGTCVKLTRDVVGGSVCREVMWRIVVLVRRRVRNRNFVPTVDVSPAKKTNTAWLGSFVASVNVYAVLEMHGVMCCYVQGVGVCSFGIL